MDRSLSRSLPYLPRYQSLSPGRSLQHLPRNQSLSPARSLQQLSRYQSLSPARSPVAARRFPSVSFPVHRPRVCYIDAGDATRLASTSYRPHRGSPSPSPSRGRSYRVYLFGHGAPGPDGRTRAQHATRVTRSLSAHDLYSSHVYVSQEDLVPSLRQAEARRTCASCHDLYHKAPFHPDGTAASESGVSLGGLSDESSSLCGADEFDALSQVSFSSCAFTELTFDSEHDRGDYSDAYCSGTEAGALHDRHLDVLYEDGENLGTQRRHVKPQTPASPLSYGENRRRQLQQHDKSQAKLQALRVLIPGCDVSPRSSPAEAEGGVVDQKPVLSSRPLAQSTPHVSPRNLSEATLSIKAAWNADDGVLDEIGRDNGVANRNVHQQQQQPPLQAARALFVDPDTSDAREWSSCYSSQSEDNFSDISSATVASYTERKTKLVKRASDKPASTKRVLSREAIDKNNANSGDNNNGDNNIGDKHAGSSGLDRDAERMQGANHGIMDDAHAAYVDSVDKNGGASPNHTQTGDNWQGRQTFHETEARVMSCVYASSSETGNEDEGEEGDEENEEEDSGSSDARKVRAVSKSSRNKVAKHASAALSGKQQTNQGGRVVSIPLISPGKHGQEKLRRRSSQYSPPSTPPPSPTNIGMCDSPGQRLDLSQITDRSLIANYDSKHATRAAPGTSDSVVDQVSSVREEEGENHKQLFRSVERGGIIHAEEQKTEEKDENEIETNEWEEAEGKAGERNDQEMKRTKRDETVGNLNEKTKEREENKQRRNRSEMVTRNSSDATVTENATYDAPDTPPGYDRHARPDLIACEVTGKPAMTCGQSSDSVQERGGEAGEDRFGREREGRGEGDEKGHDGVNGKKEREKNKEEEGTGRWERDMKAQEREKEGQGESRYLITHGGPEQECGDAGVGRGEASGPSLALPVAGDAEERGGGGGVEGMKTVAPQVLGVGPAQEQRLRPTPSESSYTLTVKVERPGEESVQTERGGSSEQTYTGNSPDVSTVLKAKQRGTGSKEELLESDVYNERLEQPNELLDTGCERYKSEATLVLNTSPANKDGEINSGENNTSALEPDSLHLTQNIAGSEQQAVEEAEDEEQKEKCGDAEKSPECVIGETRCMERSIDSVRVAAARADASATRSAPVCVGETPLVFARRMATADDRETEANQAGDKHQQQHPIADFPTESTRISKFSSGPDSSFSDTGIATFLVSSSGDFKDSNCFRDSQAHTTDNGEYSRLRVTGRFEAGGNQGQIWREEDITRQAKRKSIQEQTSGSGEDKGTCRSGNDDAVTPVSGDFIGDRQEDNCAVQRKQVQVTEVTHKVVKKVHSTTVEEKHVSREQAVDTRNNSRNNYVLCNSELVDNQTVRDSKTTTVENVEDTLTTTTTTTTTTLDLDAVRPSPHNNKTTLDVSAGVVSHGDISSVPASSLRHDGTAVRQGQASPYTWDTSHVMREVTPSYQVRPDPAASPPSPSPPPPAMHHCDSPLDSLQARLAFISGQASSSIISQGENSTPPRTYRDHAEATSVLKQIVRGDGYADLSPPGTAQNTGFGDYDTLPGRDTQMRPGPTYYSYSIEVREGSTSDNTVACSNGGTRTERETYDNDYDNTPSITTALPKFPSRHHQQNHHHHLQLLKTGQLKASSLWTLQEETDSLLEAVSPKPSRRRLTSLPSDDEIDISGSDLDLTLRQGASTTQSSGQDTSTPARPDKRRKLISESSDFDDSDGNYSSISTGESASHRSSSYGREQTPMSDEGDIATGRGPHGSSVDGPGSFTDFLGGLDSERATGKRNDSHVGSHPGRNTPELHILEVDERRAFQANASLDASAGSTHTLSWAAAVDDVANDPSSRLHALDLDLSRISSCESPVPSEVSETSSAYTSTGTAQVRRQEMHVSFAEVASPALITVTPKGTKRPASPPEDPRQRYVEEKVRQFDDILDDFHQRSGRSEATQDMEVVEDTSEKVLADRTSSSTNLGSSNYEDLYRAFTNEDAEKKQNNTCVVVEDENMGSIRFKRYLKKSHTKRKKGKKLLRFLSRLSCVSEGVKSNELSPDKSKPFTKEKTGSKASSPTGSLKRGVPTPYPASPSQFQLRQTGARLHDHNRHHHHQLETSSPLSPSSPPQGSPTSSTQSVGSSRSRADSAYSSVSESLSHGSSSSPKRRVTSPPSFSLSTAPESCERSTVRGFSYNTTFTPSTSGGDRSFSTDSAYGAFSPTLPSEMGKGEHGDMLSALSDVFEQLDVCEGEIDQALLSRMRFGHNRADPNKMS